MEQVVQISPSYFRILQEDDGETSDGPIGTPDGPIIVLVVVCILFCFVWTPMLCQRRCRQRSRQQAEEQAADIIRGSLRNLNLLGGRNVTDHSGTGTGGGMRMSQEDRRKFIQNVLVSRRIVQITTTDTTVSDDGLDLENDNGNDDDDGLDKEQDSSRKTTLLLTDVMDYDNKASTTASTTKHISSVEPCAICLNDYQQDEILCWSQSTKCQHFFHRDCMEEWLLSHHECPCCRNNYLGLGDEDVDVDMMGQAASSFFSMSPSSQRHDPHNLPPSSQVAVDMDDTSAFLRGIHLFHLLSRLQSLAEATPATTMLRVEGLAALDDTNNGTTQHGGNLEIVQGSASPERNASTSTTTGANNDDEEQRGLQMQQAGRGMSMRFRTGRGSVLAAADRSEEQVVAREPAVAAPAVGVPPEDNSSPPVVDTTSPDPANREESSSGENNQSHV